MNPTSPSLKVVIVEDNVSLADIYKTRLEILGYQCFAAYDGEAALQVIEKERPHLVLLDRFVDQILKPEGQTEDVSLETKGSEKVTD